MRTRPAEPAPDGDCTQGLYRGTIAGVGASLVEAIERIEQSSCVERILRHPQRDILAGRVNLAPHEGEGFWELTRIRNDIFVIVADYQYKDARFEVVPGDGLVQFNFKVSGDLNYGVHDPKPLRFNRPSLHVWRQPRGIEMREWTAPNAHERMVAISVRPEFLLQHFLSSGREIPVRLKAFVDASSAQIEFCQTPITAQMLQLTTQLVENAYTGAPYLVNAEALASQLLCAAVESFWSLPDAPTEEYSDRKLAALGAARQYAMRQFSPAPTVRTIARVVGLGEKTLMRGFQSAYGESIVDFSVRCRMQHAMTLLRDHQWSVDRASEAVGYSHPTSFTAAFRRHFGMRPIDAKRRC